nr:hypothetical protein [Tanacetum cinerariifolium]
MYPTVDARKTAQEMWEAIERLQQEIIYKPTNNNLRTSSNSRNKNVDTTLRYKNDNQSAQFGNQRTITIAGARKNVGTPVVHRTGIQCFNFKEFSLFAKDCRKPKRVKDSTYHKEKMLQCKLAEQETSKTMKESNRIRDSCLVALQTKQIEFEKYKACNDRTVDYDKLELVKDKHDELVKQSLLTKSHYEGLVKKKIKAQSEKPCLYEIPNDQSDPTNRLVLDKEETLTLAGESRSKLNKDFVRPYDYTRLNSLYEIFKPTSQGNHE